MAAAAILKIAFLAITHRPIVRPITAKFCMKKQNGMSAKAHDKNYKFLKSKMADGRHFENR